MHKKSRRADGTCVYCGIAQAATRDHVVPKCLFPKPLPLTMVTVPACHECNHSKSLDETYFRDILVIDIYSSKHPTAKAIFSGQMARARDNNRSEVARIARHAKLEPLHTPGGLYLGHHPTMPLDWERVSRVVTLIIHGLYFQLRREIMPRDCTTDVRRLDPLDVGTAWEAISASHFNGPYRLGDGVFQCVVQVVAEDPRMTRWLLWFYQNYALLVTTKPETSNPNLNPPW